MGPQRVAKMCTRAEFKAERIKGSVHVPIGELADRVRDLSLDKDRPVVAVCLSGHRSVTTVHEALPGGLAGEVGECRAELDAAVAPEAPAQESRRAVPDSPRGWSWSDRSRGRKREESDGFTG